MKTRGSGGEQGKKKHLPQRETHKDGTINLNLVPRGLKGERAVEGREES